MSETTIELKDAKIYQRDMLILNEVNLEVRRGEFVYLIGKTGTGKSSLLKTLYGDLELREGKGHVAGFNLNELNRKQIPFLRRKIGIVFQDFQLLMDRSVDENLKFVMKATGWKDKLKMDERAEKVLEDVGLSTKGYKMPHQLSGGEQQRLAIARALINDPDLILADEPTGNLDPETSGGIIELLFDISEKNRSVLMASHDYTIMERFHSRTIRCENQTLKTVDPVGDFNPGKPL